MLTIRDIAKKAGVSIATVSRYLDPAKKRLVHPDTQKELETVIQKHRYIPNQSARILSKRVTNTLGMVTPFSSDIVKSDYFEGLIAGIIDGIKPLDYDLKWIMIKDEDINRSDLKMLLQKHLVDGIIFLAWRIYPNLVREIEQKKNLPAVLINDYEPRVRSSIISCDNKSGVEAICSYLTAKGYKKIGMFRGPEYISLDARERFQAFKESAKKFAFRFSEAYCHTCPRFEEDEAYHKMVEWIRSRTLPDAIFCANDELARGAIRALREQKINVPQDIGIVGFDDSETNKFFDPPLTSVRQPLEKMGRAAVQVLIKLISGKIKSSIQLKFQPELIVRQSA